MTTILNYNKYNNLPERIISIDTNDTSESVLLKVEKLKEHYYGIDEDNKNIENILEELGYPFTSYPIKFS